MRLEELLKNRLKSLYRSLNKTSKILNSNKTRLNEINENIDLLNIFLEDIKDDTSIRNINTGFITELLQKYHYIDGKKIEEDLKVIKILLKGIHDNNLKITLNQEQKEVLIFYKDSVIKLVSELNETKVKIIDEFNSINEEYNSLEDLIIRIEILVEKISNKEDDSILTMEDLDTVRIISEDISIDAEIRKNILIKFIEYNNDRKNGISKNNKIDIEAVNKTFKNYGKDMSHIIKKYYDEVNESANIKNINDILEYMNSIGILNKFSNADLLAICLYGSVESVKDAYEEISKKEDNLFYYSIASTWIYNMEGRVTRKKRYNGKEKSDIAKKSLNAVAHMISIKEVDNNISYLESEGFVFDPSEVGSRKTLVFPNYKLKEAVNALKLYGIVNKDNISSFKIWLLSEPQLLEKIDRFVELGLLGGEETYEEYANYLKKYPSKLHNIDYSVYMQLYKMRQTYSSESYYTTISSTKRGQLSGSISSMSFTDPSEIEKYRRENFVDYSKTINNYDKYESIIDNSFNVEIDESIYGLKEIEYLEQNCRINANPYLYVFDGIIISRFKVLRNYSLIKDGSKDSLLTSIVNGSFLTSESFDKIAKCINYTLGGNDGLSKKL